MTKSRVMHQIVVFGVPAFFAISAAAHHGPNSEPLYDTSQLVELEGEVTEVFWRNPHARFRIRVTAGPQTGEIWEMESNPPGPLRRGGVTPELLPIGSEVKVAGSVSRRKPRSMGLLNLLLPNGLEFVDIVSSRSAPLRFSEEKLTLETVQVSQERIEAARQEAEGIFRVWAQGRAGLGNVDDSELTEAAKAVKATFDRETDSGILECKPPGMPTALLQPSYHEFVDEGSTIKFHINEYDLVRTIHMNSDLDPEAQPATPLGFSVGRWEGETLVVTTTRLDWPFLDRIGSPQSANAMHIERFTPTANGQTMDYERTTTDPVYLIGSGNSTRTTFHWRPGMEIEPYECQLWE